MSGGSRAIGGICFEVMTIAMANGNVRAVNACEPQTFERSDVKFFGRYIPTG